MMIVKNKPHTQSDLPSTRYNSLEINRVCRNKANMYTIA